MYNDEESDGRNQSSNWHAGGLMEGQPVDPMTRGGMGQCDSRALKLISQPAGGASREPLLIKKTWCQVMEDER